MNHIFVTVQGDEIVPYGNLKTLVETIGLGEKYQTIRRKIHEHGKAVLEFGEGSEAGSMTIRKLFIIRGTKKG